MGLEATDSLGDLTDGRKTGDRITDGGTGLEVTDGRMPPLQ